MPFRAAAGKSGVFRAARPLTQAFNMGYLFGNLHTQP
jgi:hypothetical protein